MIQVTFSLVKKSIYSECITHDVNLKTNIFFYIFAEKMHELKIYFK